jgi:riboflavin biosynthesis pyrimidine reductase
MSVIATLNIAANGATSSGGSSAPISSLSDRKRFLALHRRAGVHIIGGNSASSELYSTSTIPLVILTRSQESHFLGNREIINTSDGLPKVMREIRTRFSEPIVVEAGPTLLLALIEQGCIEEIELSISPLSGDGNFVDKNELISHFEITSNELSEGTQLLQGRYNGDSAYR